MSQSKKSRILILVLLAIILTLNVPFSLCAPDEGYGEANENLGQFTDTFQNENYVSLLSNVVVNTTLECVELKYSVGAVYGNFSNSFDITIDHNLIRYNLTDFPVLLNISDDSGLGNDDITAIFDEIGNSYEKIAITSDSQLVEYYVEVEYWNSSEEKGYVWTSFNISSLENTIIRFFFDENADNNSAYIGITNSIPAENVWDENFILVWHMKDDPDTSHVRDSTTSDTDGVKGSANNPLMITEGQIDSAQDFSADEIIHTTFLDNMPDDLTVEMFIKLDVINVAQYPFEKENILGKDRIKIGIGADNKVRFWGEALDGGVKDVYSSNTLTSGVWYYLAGVHNHSMALRNYLDLVESVGDILGVISDGNVRDFHIGRSPLDTYAINGKLDEIRISNVPRSYNWLNTSYLSGKDILIDWLSLSTGGYECNGYFITEDYLNYYYGSSLVLMTNSTVPSGTTLKAQFSKDNSTWVDNKNVTGSTTIYDGFLSLDLRDLSFKDIYVRFIFTGTVSSTPRLYQSRLISTEGPPPVDTTAYLGIGLILAMAMILLADKARR